MNSENVKIISAATLRQIEDIRELFYEYGKIRNFDEAMGDFESELANLPGYYSPPEGRLLIAYSGEEPAGCVAYRKLEDGICEMKRFYVRNKYRGKGIGNMLVNKIIIEAINEGYDLMRLDTHPWMKSAQKIYSDIGFKEIDPYYHNPTKGARYFELKLEKS